MKKEIKKRRKRCPSCGKLKDDVCVRPDSYAIEINNDKDATMICCEDCADENAGDI